MDTKEKVLAREPEAEAVQNSGGWFIGIAPFIETGLLPTEAEAWAAMLHRLDNPPRCPGHGQAMSRDYQGWFCDSCQADIEYEQDMARWGKYMSGDSNE